MAEQGWIHPFAFQNDALSADTVGRQAMADGFVQNAKIEDATITAGKLASHVFLTGYYGLGTYGTSIYG